MDNQLEHEQIIYSILKKYHLYDKREDYLDVGYIGYVKALNNHDESKGSMRTYIYKCVENEIMNQLRHESRNKRQGIELELTDYLQDTTPSNIDLEEDFITTEQYADLYLALDQLTSEERLVISNLYKLNDSNLQLTDLCNELNKTISQVRTIKNNALAKLRTEIGEEYV